MRYDNSVNMLRQNQLLGAIQDRDKKGQKEVFKTRQILGGISKVRSTVDVCVHEIDR